MRKENSVLVIGGGGRETALVHKYSQSPEVHAVYAAPGNDSMQDTTEKPLRTFPNIKTTDISDIITICREERITLVDIAQDNAVEAGLADRLSEEGIAYIGPKREAGRLEWDKGYAREFMRDNGIPHPAFKVCQTPEEGYQYVAQHPGPLVVKANGLAEGKGVLLTNSSEETIKAIDEMKQFKGAGNIFLLEQMLIGEEFSTFAISDGNTYQIIGSAQDHKRVNDGDQGKNTGGMGCSTPPVLLTEEIMQTVRTDILDKTFKGMKKANTPYTGILYLGGMHVDKRGKPNVIEYNARWGDPEAQVIVTGIINDLFKVSLAVATRNLNSIQIQTDGKARVAVAGTSRGYPDDYSEVKGKIISGLENARNVEGVMIYGAGIKKVNGRNYANGGRLFYVVGEGNTVIDARKKAYEAMDKIRIDGGTKLLHFRRDIGWRDVNRLQTNIK